MSQHRGMCFSEGTMDLRQATIAPHEFDHLRFNITSNDIVFHLRAETRELREEWMSALIDSKVSVMMTTHMSLIMVTLTDGSVWNEPGSQRLVSFSCVNAVVDLHSIGDLKSQVSCRQGE